VEPVGWLVWVATGSEDTAAIPETVRAAVFEAVQASQADLVAEWPDHFRNSLDLMADSCAVSPDCHDAYGDISAVLNELVEQLDAQPVDVEVFGYTVRMDGAALTDAVRRAFFDTQTIPRLPFLLTSAADGNLVPLAICNTSSGDMDLPFNFTSTLEYEIRAGALQPDPTYSWGMHWSVHSRDYYSVTDQDAVIAARGTPAVCPPHASGPFVA
jgi:hypothetical protein